MEQQGAAAAGVGAAGPAFALTSARRDVLFLFASAIAARLWFVFAMRVDSDEPQHLHVAWGWAQGLVQYRDVFDNHLPLLHILFAPLLRIVPESSLVFVLARLAILPFALGCAWLVYRIALQFTDRRVALLAAVCFNAIPPWLPKSVEFRNDTLWIFFWLVGVALLVCRRSPSWVGAGAAFGLSLLASVKLVPLVLGHLIAFAVARQTTSIRNLLLFAAGGAIPVAVVLGSLAALGALDDMIYQTLLFNAAAPVDPLRRGGGALAFAVLLPLLAWKAPAFARRRPAAEAHGWLLAGSYLLVLVCFWPILTPRDYMPVAPLAAFAIVHRMPLRGAAAPLVLFVAVTCTSIAYVRLWRPVDRSRELLVDEAVRLTRPGDLVYDLKGDAIFRRRPIRLIYEDVGRALTARGTLADRGPEAIAAAGCCAAIADSTHIPPRTRAFLQQHFVTAGLLRVCGAVVRDGTFEIGVPQVYAVVARDPARLQIDGKPYAGPLRLEPGRHTLTGPGGEGAMVVWWPAVKEGG